jgi:FkbM family methyltransferase
MLKNIIIKILRKILESFGINSGIRHQLMDNNPFLRQSKLIKEKNPIIFDIGAHEGESIKQFKKLWKDEVRVYSFEASKRNFSNLYHKFNGMKNVKLEHKAVSNFNGIIEFNINKSSFTNSILPTIDLSDDRLEHVATESVAAITIDKYCQEHNINKIDILKIDVQGAEMLVLEGSEEMLKKGHISLVYLEICFKNQYKNQVSFADIFNFLIKFNFRLINIYDFSYTQHKELRYADAIFYRE